MGGYFLYKSRHVSTDFQEGKWVGYALASQLQVLLYGIPCVAATQSTDTTIPFIVLGLAVLTINIVLLLALFVPKIYRLRYGKQTPQLESDKDGGEAQVFRTYERKRDGSESNSGSSSFWRESPMAFKNQRLKKSPREPKAVEKIDEEGQSKLEPEDQGETKQGSDSTSVILS